MVREADKSRSILLRYEEALTRLQDRTVTSLARAYRKELLTWPMQTIPVRKKKSQNPAEVYVPEWRPLFERMTAYEISQFLFHGTHEPTVRLWGQGKRVPTGVDLIRLRALRKALSLKK